MLYLATASGPLVRRAIDAGVLGLMNSPNVGNTVKPGWTWAADNGRFRPGVTTAVAWDADLWLRFLERLRPMQDRCLFAVVPDEVGDARATDRLFGQWAGSVKGLGYRVAYVTQDGAAAETVPWDGCDAIFTGGTDAWKESAEAQALVEEARRRGKWTHMGRVNTKARILFAAARGYDSVDGTCLAWGPDANLPKILRYLRRAHEPALFPFEGVT